MTAGRLLRPTAVVFVALSIVIGSVVAAHSGCRARVVNVQPTIKPKMVQIDYQVVDTSNDDDTIDRTRSVFLEFQGNITVESPFAGGPQMELSLPGLNKVPSRGW
jgi:hypothetical protein